MDVKLKLTIKDNEIELTEKEAKELYTVLKNLVGDKESVRVIERFKEYWPYYYYWWNNIPYYKDDPHCTTIYSSTNGDFKLSVNQDQEK